MQNLQIGGLETRSKVAGTQIVARDYSVFANGTCFEFSLVVAVDDLTQESDLKPADSLRIMHQLEKIVSSFQIPPKRNASSMHIR
jgi:hypothetical protein